ncbi:hypothetical protein DENSPDRAFT_164154 [Dentipellis sp. KUC8613]|nr:hypothetical protein DENSPDRAFT_164154 [Dentipellis sp. KUC8613]
MLIFYTFSAYLTGLSADVCRDTMSAATQCPDAIGWVFTCNEDFILSKPSVVADSTVSVSVTLRVLVLSMNRHELMRSISRPSCTRRAPASTSGDTSFNNHVLRRTPRLSPILSSFLGVGRASRNRSEHGQLTLTQSSLCSCFHMSSFGN